MTLKQEIKETILRQHAVLDDACRDSILAYARLMEGLTPRQVLELGIEPPGGSTHDYANPKYKGGLGILIEERFFGYKANNDEFPDFPAADTELKATPYRLLQRGDYSAKERLVLCMISFNVPIADELEGSPVWSKLKSILMIHYLHEQGMDKMDFMITHATLYSPPCADKRIMGEDYRKIASLIRAGDADALSESLTFYLGACTKAATSSDRKIQYYPPYNPAKPRAFSLKRQYMDYVLNNYVLGSRKDCERIVKDDDELLRADLEDIITERIEHYVGMTDREIAATLGLKYTGNKAQWTRLAFGMLGVSGNSAEEFVKGNVSVRTIRMKEDGRIVESLSLTPFEFSDLVLEEWNPANDEIGNDGVRPSALREYLDETNFFFVTFRERGDDFVLMGSYFYTMSQSLLDDEVQSGWRAIQSKIIDGIEFSHSSSNAIGNDLPKKRDNSVIHVRPHASKSAYKLNDGILRGDLNKDGSELPDGQIMTKQSFWLNNNFLMKILSPFAKIRL